MKNEPRSYCYILLDPRKPGRFSYTMESGRTLVLHAEPFYVGKGINLRCYSHVRDVESGKAKPSHKTNKIRSILNCGLEPIVEKTRANKTDREALDLERELIALIGRRDTHEGPLTNKTDGGEGLSGAIQTSDWISKRVSSTANAKSQWTEGQKERFSESVKYARSQDTLAEWMAREGKRQDSFNKSKKESGRKQSVTKSNWSRDHKQDVIRKYQKTLASKPDVKCPHCDRVGRATGMTRWHFDNCKLNPNVLLRNTDDPRLQPGWKRLKT
jgi:hypothetical protein